jgi:hypothetical protein
MLTLYRRHRANCKSTARRAKCFCPIWVQGILRGENIRKSLDLTNWEAANKLVRDWEVEKPKEIPTIEEAAKRFLADLGSRGLSRDTIKKFERQSFFSGRSGEIPGKMDSEADDGQQETRTAPVIF